MSPNLLRAVTLVAVIVAVIIGILLLIPPPEAPWLEAIERNAYEGQDEFEGLVELDSMLHWEPADLEPGKGFDYFSFRAIIMSAQMTSYRFSLADVGSTGAPSIFDQIAEVSGPCPTEDHADQLRLMEDESGRHTGSRDGSAVYGEAVGEQLLSEGAVFWHTCRERLLPPVEDDKGNVATSFTFLIRSDRAHEDLAVRALHPRLGVPRASDPLVLRLVESPFRMVSIGDSVIWGQGHPEDAKFVSQIGEIVEAGLETTVRAEQLAHSGARIGAANQCDDEEVDGEVPRPQPSVLCQLGRIEQPERVDLMIMNGCINDLGAFGIATGIGRDGEGLTTEALRTHVEDNCGSGMRELALKARTELPNAEILVLGYFPLLSLGSMASCPTQVTVGGLTVAGAIVGGSLASLTALAVMGPAAIPLLPGIAMEGSLEGGATAAVVSEAGVAAFLADAEERSEQWVEESNEALLDAVQAAESAEEVEGVGVGDIHFVQISERFLGHEALTPDPWLFGVDCFFVSEDSEEIRSARAPHCQDFFGGGVGLEQCLRAAAFHPNAAGVDSIVGQLTETLLDVGVLPPDE